MLTFFRRIRKGLLGEGTVPKYLLYAIGEILLVMIGILLALQVNNWNQLQKDRRTEKDLLFGIKKELVIAKSVLERGIQVHEMYLNNNLNAMRLFNADLSFHTDREIDSTISRMITGYTFDPSYGFIKSVINSGKINFIRNEELVTLISQFEDAILDAKEEIDLCNDLTETQIRPLMRRYVPLNSKFTVERNPFWSIMPASLFEPDYEAFFKDRELESALATWCAWLRVAIGEEKGLLESITNTISLIDAELE